MGWLGISNFATWHPLEHHVATNCADRLRDVHDYYEECADWSSEEQASLESLESLVFGLWQEGVSEQNFLRVLRQLKASGNEGLPSVGNF